MSEKASVLNWTIRDRVLSTNDHTLVMGIVNSTPDSFSDGGRFSAVETAVAHGLTLWDQGADIVDVGGESTRPGAEPVAADEEISRVVPVISALTDRGVVVSVDTMKAEVAVEAISAGAHIVNDVTALADPSMASVCAQAGVGVVLMHMQGNPQTMQDDPQYDDVLRDVAGYLEARIQYALAAGIERSSLCVDPGIGFGKTFDQNLELLNGLDRLAGIDVPLLVGPSRKGFLGTILRNAGFETVAAERDAATAATVALAVRAGASVLRVHNVSHAVQAARTADAMVRSLQRRN